jgi:uncharacterized membrane protein
MQGAQEDDVMESVNENEWRIDDTRDVIMVSCYGDLDSARRDFDELARQIKKKRVEVRESVLLGRSTDGTPVVLGTSSGHHGRTGAIVGASMGFLLGLLTMPALPVSVAVGTVAGAAVAKFADHTLKAGLRHDIAEHLAEATGVVITVVGALDELWARHALSSASTYVAVPFPDSTIASLERAVAEAMAERGSQ